MKAVGRCSVFGYFEGYGPNMQYPNDAYRIMALKRLPRPRISAPPAFLHSELLKKLSAPGGSFDAIFNEALLDVARKSHGEQVPTVSSSLVDDISFGAPAVHSGTERPRSINLSYQSVDALPRERSVYNCNSAHALLRQSISTRGPAKHVQSEGRFVEYSRADASERHGLSH
jgi:hypothetical protein